MAEIKTKPNDTDVAEFLRTIEDPGRRADAQEVCALMQSVTGDPPVMWGDAIVGFGSYHYRYASGREGEYRLQDVDITVLRELIATSVQELRTDG